MNLKEIDDKENCTMEIDNVMAEKPHRIGLFGGSFDPFTVAHMAIVDAVLENDLVDLVVVLPTIVDYHRCGKNKWLSAADKFKVMYEFVSRSPNNEKIMLDFREIHMKSNGELSDEDVKNWRFVNTLERCQGLFGNSELFTIVGTDSLRNFKTWHRHEDIIKKSKLIGVVGRNGEIVETDIEYTPVSIPEKFSMVSSSSIREKFNNVDDYLKSVFGG